LSSLLLALSSPLTAATTTTSVGTRADARGLTDGRDRDIEGTSAEDLPCVDVVDDAVADATAGGGSSSPQQLQPFYRLQEGWSVENGTCVSSAQAVWYYELVTAPICSSGLQEGYPSHLHLRFGSLGQPATNAFDFRHYGLDIPEGGMLTVQLGPQFLYDTDNVLPAQGLFTLELGLGYVAFASAPM